MEIGAAILAVGVIGLVIGFALVFAGQKFRVNAREAAARGALPGNNCGACAQKCTAKVVSDGNVKIEVAAS